MTESILTPVIRMFHISSLCLLTALLTGCMTPYQPRGTTGGYVDQKIDDRTFQVSFFGNGNTPRDRVYRFWLYRCAELTAQNGFDFFRVIGAKPSAQRSYDFIPTGDYAKKFPVEYLEPARTVSRVPTVVYVPGGNIRTWSARGYIRMYKGKVDPGDPLSFDAKQVMADLNAEIQDGNMRNPENADYKPDRVFPSNNSNATAVRTPDKPRGDTSPIGVDMKDLQGLLPPSQ